MEKKLYKVKIVFEEFALAESALKAIEAVNDGIPFENLETSPAESFADEVKRQAEIPKTMRESLPWGTEDETKTVLDYVEVP